MVGGFNFFNFHPHFGKMPILTNIFQTGWNHQPEKHWNSVKEDLLKPHLHLLSSSHMCVFLRCFVELDPRMLLGDPRIYTFWD